ncbi:hypothetical protein GGF32_001185 [Allomyces javanicus]|nr:hypothetical protein GGF32_001185 [Allomyces javanicus]
MLGTTACRRSSATMAAATVDSVEWLVAQSKSFSQQARSLVVDQATKWIHAAPTRTTEMRCAAEALTTSVVTSPNARELVCVLLSLEADLHALRNKYAPVFPDRGTSRPVMMARWPWIGR